MLIQRLHDALEAVLLYESAFGNKVSFIILHDAGLTVHVCQTRIDIGVLSVLAP